jgi:hypothetical protein
VTCLDVGTVTAKAKVCIDTSKWLTIDGVSSGYLNLGVLFKLFSRMMVYKMLHYFHRDIRVYGELMFFLVSYFGSTRK